MDFDTSLRALSVLSDALTVPRTLNESLERIAEMTGNLMETEQTVLLLRDEGRRELVVRTRVGIHSRRIRAGHPLDVPERLKNILWRVRSLRQINWVDSGIEDIGFPILVVPLRIRGERVGVLITGKARGDATGFNEIQRRLCVLVASFASLVIENAKVYDYLRQQFAQRSEELIQANRQEAASEAAKQARKGQGPTLIECKTYRHRGHTEGDPGTAYRSREEVEEWKAKDPIPRFENMLLELNVMSRKKKDAVKAAVLKELEEGEAFAEASDYPDLEEITRDVYAP